MTERVAHLAGRGAFDIEALGGEAAVALTDPAEPKPGPLVSESELFTLTAADLEHVRILREKRSKGVGTGVFELVPYFWTKATAKTPSKPTATTAKLLVELEKAKTQPLWRVLVALSIRHVGPAPHAPWPRRSAPWTASGTPPRRTWPMWTAWVPPSRPR
ncbi:DNA ligase [Arthrobacter sp. Hiyo4]|nr:DNA ligase [Arthrobacter sp. Hiyo4]